MGPLSLGRPKWGGSTWTKEAHVGKAPRRKLPPPWGASTRGRETLGRPPRAAPSSKVASPPLPL